MFVGSCTVDSFVLDWEDKYSDEIGRRKRVLRRDLTTLTSSLASSNARFDEDYNLKWFFESITVVDQSVDELCRLVSDSVLDLSLGLLELQSTLDGCDSKLVPVFVKGLGVLIRIGYEQKHGDWNFNSIENHPFVRILSCRVETQTELLHQGASLINGFPLLLHAVMKNCRYSDCLCGVLSMSQGRTQKTIEISAALSRH
ncbi:hypothetical protein Rs2_49003 [Raphanus sativus]|nr:hypothetical protein Rs2_49003 [Raphanus sativus]